eukprot:9686103-Ditylum_brightwellii.AAC.1
MARGVFICALYSFSLLGTGSSHLLHAGFTLSYDRQWGDTGHYMGAYLRLFFFLILLKRTDVPHFVIGMVPLGCLQGDPEYGLSCGWLLPIHRRLNDDEAPASWIKALHESLVLAHGGMSQNVGPVLEM